METRAYMFAIRRNAMWISIFIVVGFAAGFFLAKMYKPDTTSEVSLLINFEHTELKGHNETERYAFSMLNAVNMDRIYSLVFCDEMLQYLDSTLKLSEQYDINKAKFYSSNKLKKVFISKIKIKKESENVLIIQAKHANPDFAALLVNTIADKLIDLNLSFAKNMILQRTKMYASIIDDLAGKTRKNSEALKNNFAEIASLSREIKNPENYRRAFEIQSKLEFAFTNFEALNADFAKANENHVMTLKAFDDYKSTSIYILNKAFPDYETVAPWYIGSLAIGVAAAFMSFCICCVLIYFYYTNKEYVTILFTGR